MTCCAILAVDFPLFPRRFVKTETYGTSLMDIGVGAFIISGGLVSKLTKNNNNNNLPIKDAAHFKAELSRIFPVLLLGIGRILIVSGVDYQEHVSEYGVHWNFFFTLGCLSILTLLFEQAVWRPIFLKRNGWYITQDNQPLVLFVLGLLCLLLHQWNLSLNGIGNWINDEKIERTNVWNANKEGLCSLCGFFGLHLMATGWGKWKRSLSVTGVTGVTRTTATTVKERGRLLQYGFLLCLCLLLWFCRNVCNIQSSRKMANMTYCLWVFLHNISLLAVLEEVERYQQKACSAAHTAMIVEAPALLSAINKNQLIVFMIANPMTGILNLTIRTIYVVEWWNALGWVMGYMLAVSSVAWLLSKYRIKL